MTNLDGRTATVIGGGSGIGRGIALALSAEKMQVVVGDIEGESAAAVAEEIRARGGRADAATVDGTDRASLAELANRALANQGEISVLSTNVGVFADRALDSASEEDWAWFLQFNLLSAVRAVDVFLPHLRASGRPTHIVVTASMAALRVVPPAQAGGVHLGLYTTTKHALLGYTETLRAELEPEGIGVSLLCPGTVRSNLAATSHRLAPGAARQRRPDPPPAAPAITGEITGEDVGRCVVRGIEADRFYILTHPDARRSLEQRHTALMEDLAFYAEP